MVFGRAPTCIALLQTAHNDAWRHASSVLDLSCLYYLPVLFGSVSWDGLAVPVSLSSFMPVMASFLLFSLAAGSGVASPAPLS